SRVAAWPRSGNSPACAAPTSARSWASARRRTWCPAPPCRTPRRRTAAGPPACCPAGRRRRASPCTTSPACRGGRRRSRSLLLRVRGGLRGSLLGRRCARTPGAVTRRTGRGGRLERGRFDAQVLGHEPAHAQLVLAAVDDPGFGVPHVLERPRLATRAERRGEPVHLITRETVPALRLDQHHRPAVQLAQRLGDVQRARVVTGQPLPHLA